MSFVSVLRAQLFLALHRRAILGVAGLGVVILLAAVWWNHSLVAQSRQAITEANDYLAEAERSAGSPEDLQKLSQGMEDSAQAHRGRISALSRLLSPSHSHGAVIAMLGTMPGVLLAIVLGATLFGAEFRWNYWKTALIQQPRRVVIVFAKFGTLAILLLAFLVLALVVSYPLHAAFARLYRLQVQAGWPIMSDLLPNLVRAWFTMTVYGVAAASVTMMARSSMAGGSVVAFIWVDALAYSLTRERFTDIHRLLARYSPAVQVARLLGKIPTTWSAFAYSWPVSGFHDSTGLGVGVLSLYKEPELPAMFVLLAVMFVSVALAVTTMRFRDIPI